jgi:hypothetical protein
MCALAGDVGFSVKRQSETKDLEILEQARRKFDDRKLPERKGGGADTRPQQQQPQQQQQQRKFA